MATYLELHALRTDADLLNRISVALLVSCEQIRVEAANVPFHQNRVAWAQQTIKNPDASASMVLGLLLAANKALTPVQISAVSDAGIQTAVDALVNTLTGRN